MLGDGATDLHTVAHEAARVVQQRAGVQLTGGVGEAGDPYERHADEIADRVVQGKSAESLLDAMGPARGAAPASSVQCQRKKPRRTETRILGEMASDTGSLDDGHSDALVDKMGKDQTFKRARAIAKQIEAASEELVSALPDEKDRRAVRKAINDYVSDSTPIQTHARDNPGDPNGAVAALDAALEMIQTQIDRIGAGTDRIVYRSVSYSDVTESLDGVGSACRAACTGDGECGTGFHLRQRCVRRDPVHPGLLRRARGLRAVADHRVEADQRPKGQARRRSCRGAVGARRSARVRARRGARARSGPPGPAARTQA